MNTVTLKREYALEMPMNYVDIDTNEMQYVDGGWDALGWMIGYGLTRGLEVVIAKLATRASMVAVATKFGISATVVAGASVGALAGIIAGLGYAAVYELDRRNSGKVNNDAITEYNRHRYCCNSMKMYLH